MKKTTSRSKASAKKPSGIKRKTSSKGVGRGSKSLKKKATRKRKAARKKTAPRGATKPDLSDDLAEQLAEMEAAYQKRREAYHTFVESNQDRAPAERTEAWLQFVANDMELYGDAEALVYLRSRGHDCSTQIDELVWSWKRDAQRTIKECSRGISVHNICTGETERHSEMPLSEAGSVKRMSPFLLRDFWGFRDEQELSIDATMLRTVEWCEIGGFDDWWQRLARTTKEFILQVGIAPVPASFRLFWMCRSDYAIDLMGATLERVLEAIELPLDDEARPWRTMVERREENERVFRQADHNPYASSIVFGNCRLRQRHRNKELVALALEHLVQVQDDEGAWRCWSDDKRPSVKATAMCLHAIAMGRSRGWKRSAAKAVKWLWSQQSRDGSWRDPRAPDPVLLTVLVLDSIELVAGSRRVTFGRTAREARGHRLSGKGDDRGDQRYRVALSFPGELRHIVEPVAEALAQQIGRGAVFCDSFYQAELARPNLDVYLQCIYHDDSELVVVFLCSDYAEKEWCGLEWRAIRDLIKQRRDKDVMLFRTGDATIPGVYGIDGYVDTAGRTPEELADMIISRLDG